jgi:hypothetical protein
MVQNIRYSQPNRVLKRLNFQKILDAAEMMMTTLHLTQVGCIDA